MISLSRILTKLLLPDERASTIIFFLVSAGLELLCFLLHLLVRRSRFVLYYTTRPRDSRPVRAGYRVHHDVATGDIHFVSAEAWPPPPTQVPEEFRLGPALARTSPGMHPCSETCPFCGPLSQASTAPRVVCKPSTSCGLPCVEPEAPHSVSDTLRAFQLWPGRRAKGVWQILRAHLARRTPEPRKWVPKKSRRWKTG